MNLTVGGQFLPDGGARIKATAQMDEEDERVLMTSLLHELYYRIQQKKEGVA